MKWRTFERLRVEHDANVNASLMGIARGFRLNIPGLD